MMDYAEIQEQASAVREAWASLKLATPHDLPKTIHWRNGEQSGLEWLVDEEDRPYVVIGYGLPYGVFGEIDDGTYGEFQGFRVYLEL